VLDEAQDLTDLGSTRLPAAERAQPPARLRSHQQDLFGARAPLKELAEATHVLRESFRNIGRQTDKAQKHPQFGRTLADGRDEPPGSR